MKEFADKFISMNVQPQVVSLFLVVVILVIIALVVYFKTKKQQVNKAPHGLLLYAEQYVMGIESFRRETTEGKLNKPAPYIFTLMNFLVIGNLLGILGFESATSSYSVTLTLALISWIGIYVVGITYQKFHFLKRYRNPLEVITQIAPLISLSFRLFGNIIGGSVILFLIYHVTGWVWSYIPVLGEFNLLGPMITPFFHAYFDVFEGLVHAFVFTLLTLVYWSQEAEVPEKKVKKVRVREKSDAKIIQIVKS